MIFFAFSRSLYPRAPRAPAGPQGGISPPRPTPTGALREVRPKSEGVGRTFCMESLASVVNIKELAFWPKSRVL